MNLLTAFIIGLAMLLGYWIGWYSNQTRSKTEMHWDGANLVITDTGEIVAWIVALDNNTWSVKIQEDPEMGGYFYQSTRLFINQESAKNFAEENYRMP